MFKRLISSALVFGMAAIAPPARAQNCVPREIVVERLERQFNETLSSAGLQSGRSQDVIIEIWSSSQSGTFTVLVSHPTGLSCMVASGHDYFIVPEHKRRNDPAS
ncbi:hypothetical protein [Tritonibacter mobilis]|uniref:hypothetical protein n=1 Tax=Tritonibacter mobilis TaxID=379347 RepID=UPI000806954C|nr:hypothetical protein [Tritonibacter mobilis]